MHLVLETKCQSAKFSQQRPWPHTYVLVNRIGEIALGREVRAECQGILFPCENHRASFPRNVDTNFKIRATRGWKEGLRTFLSD